MMERAQMIPEPLLEVRYHQAVADPHDGLAIFGPVDTDRPEHVASLSYGLVATDEGAKAWGSFAKSFEGPIMTESDKDPRLWPPFPGFEAAFCCRWPGEPTRIETLPRDALEKAARQRDANRRAGQVVDRYLGGINRIIQRDEPVGVVICVVPDFVYLNCRPESRVADGIGNAVSVHERERRRHGQLDLARSYDPGHYSYSVDFRRQIKARSMEYGIPIQIVRESTLVLAPQADEIRSRLTPLCDRAWNLGVALYYKAGGRPWNLASAREGVCYIGIAYRLTGRGKSGRSACCAAQMFLDSGDGIVFRGEDGPWYSPERRGFHLSRQAAHDLLTVVLKSYQGLGGKPLREVFLHCRSGLDDEEFAGYSQACPEGVKLVGIRVRQEYGSIRLYREGTRPVLRGTFLQVNERSGFLWGTGFKPRLGTYDGWETPAPLRIDVQHGDADLVQVATDIHGLTKLNYNACKLGDSQPVTILFSDAVGEILVSNPTVKQREQKFRFYI